MTSDRVDVSVVLPCLNEAASVAGCVVTARGALADAGFSSEIVVCDNGSSDGSMEEARRAGAHVVREERRGYGSAMLAGIEAARGRILVLADADGSYPLEETPSFVRRVEESGALVLGSRFRGRIVPGAMPLLHRLVGSPGTRLLLRVLYGVRCSDPHCGMRAISRETFEQVRPLSRGMEFAIEMIVNAGRRSVPLVEIPIAYRTRVGESKLRTLPDGWRLLRFLALHSPTFLFLVPGLVAMAVGLAGLVLLGTADRTVGSATFSLNTLVVASLLTVTGYQIVTFGVCARAYLLGPRLGEREPALRPLQRVFTLGRGLLVSLTATAAGVGLVASVGARWLTSDFGSLSISDQRLALLGLTTAVLGLQTFFTSFFLSLFLGEDREA